MSDHLEEHLREAREECYCNPDGLCGNCERKLVEENAALKAELARLKADCDMEIRNEQLAEISKLQKLIPAEPWVSASSYQTLKAELETLKLCGCIDWKSRAAKYKEGLEAAKAMDEILCFSDKIYDVREREGEGWEGPKVKAYSQALTRFQEALKEAE